MDYERMRAAMNILEHRAEQLDDGDDDELEHHGILGMKWGIRRYQNEDGSLTELGRRHYDLKEKKMDYDLKKRKLQNERAAVREQHSNERATDRERYANERATNREQFLKDYDDMSLGRRNERLNAREQNRNNRPYPFGKLISDSEARTLEYNDREADRVYRHMQTNANRRAEEKERKRQTVRTVAKVAGGLGLAAIGGLAISNLIQNNPEAKAVTENIVENIKPKEFDNFMNDIPLKSTITNSFAFDKYNSTIGSDVPTLKNLPYVNSPRDFGPLNLSNGLDFIPRKMNTLGHADDSDYIYDVEPEDNMSTLAHIGVKYRSGRFEYGSGSRPHQHDNPYVFVDSNGNFDEFDWGNFDKLMKDTSRSLSDTKSGFETLRGFIDPDRKPMPRKSYLGQAQQMSDEELRSAINRMQMEQNYNRMMQEMYPSKRSEAEQKLAKVLAGTGMVLSVAGPAVGLAAGIVAMNKAAQDKRMMSAKEAEAVTVLNDLISKGVPIKDVNTELTNANKFINLYTTGKGGKG